MRGRLGRACGTIEDIGEWKIVDNKCGVTVK